MTELRWGSATDINQDQFLVATPLFAVADGMGGHAAGEVASKVAVDALKAVFERGPGTPQGLADAAHAANRQVWEHAQTDPDLRGMGTTLVAIALVDGSPGEQLAIANVGDSRAYRLRGHSLEQVTTDHSLVQELVDGGNLAPEDAEHHPHANVITRAVGSDCETLELDKVIGQIEPGDRFLLCSDGLSKTLSDAEIASLLGAPDGVPPPELLVAAALAHRVNDNVTAVVVEV